MLLKCPPSSKMEDILLYDDFSFLNKIILISYINQHYEKDIHPYRGILLRFCSIVRTANEYYCNTII